MESNMDVDVDVDELLSEIVIKLKKITETIEKKIRHDPLQPRHEAFQIYMTSKFSKEQPAVSGNIRNIAAIKQNESVSFGWLGDIYRRHFKQYKVIRHISIHLWRTGYPFYKIHVQQYFISSKSRKWMPLIKLSEVVVAQGITTHKLADKELVETPPPGVLPNTSADYLVSPHEQYIFPETYIATIDDGVTYGGTNLVLAAGKVICHDLFDFERDYTSEEFHHRILISPKSVRIKWLLYDLKPESIAVAATFVDACAPNYAHWLTEVLPRIAQFCTEERYMNIPIIVNDGLHENIMESLILIAGTEREIITLPIGRAIAVDKLYVTSVSGYVPYERRSNKLSNHSHGLFSPYSFRMVIKAVSSHESITDIIWPKKIFLRRNSGGRKVINSTEVETLLVENGYVVIEPEKLSFVQQVQLFKNAKSIVGSSGAALANIVFASTYADITILIGEYPDTSYWYWQNMACASGKKINYILGDNAPDNGNGIHADFTINLTDLMSKI